MSPTKDQHVTTTNHHTPGVLPQKHILFQGRYYEQVHGTAMGSPISHLIAKLFLEEFYIKTLSSALHPTHLWLRYVDDILSSRRQNTANNYYNKSTHRNHIYNLPSRNQTKREFYHSWTLWFLQVPTTLLSPLSKESPHTQANIYTVTVTTSSQHKMVFSTL